MLTILLVAAIAGVFLYITKLISFCMILSKFPKVKEWIHQTAFRLAILDVFFGMIGLHVISMAGSSVTAMFVMIIYGVCSILYVGSYSLYLQIKERRLARNVVNAL